MSDAVHADHGEHEPTQAEADRPKSGLIAIYIIGMIISTVAVVIGVYELFRSTFDAEIQSKVLDPPSSALRELRATEEARLTRYQWVSQKDGVVRIPVARAIELTLEDYRKAALAPPPPPTDTATAPAEGEEAKAEEAKAEEGKDAAAEEAATKDEAAKAEEGKKEEAKKEAAPEKTEKPAAEKTEKKKAPAPAKKPAPAPAPAPDVY